MRKEKPLTPIHKSGIMNMITGKILRDAYISGAVTIDNKKR